MDRRLVTNSQYLYFGRIKGFQRFFRAMVRFEDLVVYLSIENRIAPMAYPVTKPRSPRGSALVNVETMGGRRSRY